MGVMGLGKMLARSTRIDVTDTVTGASGTYTVVDNLGPDWPMGTAAYRGGMTIPGAWRASTMIADLLGGMPWDAYRRRTGQPLQLLDPQPPLLEQPYPQETRVATISSWVLDYLWEGNAVGVYAARNSEQWPTAVVPVPADTVQARRVKGELKYRIGSEEFDADEIFHVKGPHKPGETRGMGVLEAHLDSLTLASEQGRQARSLSRHGVPTGLLKSENPDLTPAEAADLKAKWLLAQRDRTVAVLNATTDFKPLSWNPEELQLVEARRFTLTEMELIFGLPVGWLGGMNSARQYSNIEQDAINLLKFTLGGHVARFEQEFSRHFPRGTYVKANLDAILRADTLTRYQAHEIGLRAGFLLTDEVRDLENRPPMPKPKTPPASPIGDTPADPNPDEENQP